VRPVRWDEHDDRGSLTVELVLLSPILVVVALTLVVFGRLSEARQQVVEASRAGAEAAATASTAVAGRSASATSAVANLVGRTHTCAHVEVSTDTSHFAAGGYVTVHVACDVVLSDLAVPGVPGSTVVSASATAPIDPYRTVG